MKPSSVDDPGHRPRLGDEEHHTLRLDGLGTRRSQPKILDLSKRPRSTKLSSDMMTHTYVYIYIYMIYVIHIYIYICNTYIYIYVYVSVYV